MSSTHGSAENVADLKTGESFIGKMSWPVFLLAGRNTLVEVLITVGLRLAKACCADTALPHYDK